MELINLNAISEIFKSHTSHLATCNAYFTSFKGSNADDRTPQILVTCPEYKKFNQDRK